MPRVKSIVEIAPLPEAIEKLAKKSPVRAALSSEEWEAVPLALRERAQFSSHVTSATMLARLQEKLGKRVALEAERVRGGQAQVDRSSFIGDMRALAIAEGLQPTGARPMQDIRRRERLGLIYDIQTQSAAEYARWKMEQDTDVLDAYPAQELVRIEDREVPRDWEKRWVDAGGELRDGRMVALKNDPIWRAISRFGTPWPPFDYQSGMGLVDIERGDAEALGLIQPGEEVAPAEEGFNDALEASVTALPDSLRAKLKAQFGDQIEFTDDGKVRWVGSKK